MSEVVKKHLRDAIDSLKAAKKAAIEDLREYADVTNIDKLEKDIRMLREFDDIISDIDGWLT